MLEITEELLVKLKEKQLSIDDFYLLWCKAKGNGWLLRFKPPAEVYLRMEERGYLTKSGVISAEGNLLISGIITGNEIDMVLLKEKFKEWWDKYPTHDGILHFQPSARQLRPHSQKPKCWTLFSKMVTDGEDPNLIILGLEKELLFRMSESMRTQSNVMTYKKGPAKSLEDKDYIHYSSLKMDSGLNENFFIGKDIK